MEKMGAAKTPEHGKWTCLASTNEFCAENDNQNYEDAAKAWNRRADNG
jgi:hypothetical protein